MFKKFEVTVTMDEARRFMGVAKKDHLRSMCRLSSVIDRCLPVEVNPTFL